MRDDLFFHIRFFSMKDKMRAYKTRLFLLEIRNSARINFKENDQDRLTIAI